MYYNGGRRWRRKDQQEVSLFFFWLVEVNQRHLFKVYVFLSSRITASWRGGSKQSRRLKKRKPNNLRRYYRHSRFAHVLQCFFHFYSMKVLISQAQNTPASENKKKDELDEESLDPNVRGNSFRGFGFKILALIFFYCSLPFSWYCLILGLTQNNFELYQVNVVRQYFCCLFTGNLFFSKRELLTTYCDNIASSINFAEVPWVEDILASSAPVEFCSFQIILGWEENNWGGGEAAYNFRAVKVLHI